MVDRCCGTLYKERKKTNKNKRRTTLDVEFKRSQGRIFRIRCSVCLANLPLNDMVAGKQVTRPCGRKIRDIRGNVPERR